MCGIAGIVRRDEAPVDEARLRAMADAIAHRGPDGQGFTVHGQVGLAHRRLAIIDLETGEQPMFDEEQSVAVVFNGEIYNFQALRPELERAGYRFRTHSDTEVLVHGWKAWGPGLVSRLNGMFAFAIHDRRTRKIFLARDRLGVKPLYYHLGDRSLSFASELSALLEAGDVPQEIDRAALDLYLHYQYVPSPLTIYRGVSKLEPGCWLELDHAGNTVRTERYWDIATSTPPESGRSVGEWIERLEAILKDAVRIRLISDVPFGAFLSGGTDSGTVVALMAGMLEKPVQTFSIGIAGSVDELPWARQVADRYRTEHREFQVAPEGLSLAPKLARHFGEPFADSSAVPTYYVSELARRSVKMVLTGDGGDEIFAGYRSYAALARSFEPPAPEARLPRLTQLLDPRTPLRLARRVRRRVGRALRGERPAVTRPLTWYERHDASMQHFSLDERRRLLPETPPSGTDYLAERFPFPAADSVVARAQYLDLKSYLPGDVLTKVDRMSMANSLEVRSPLLDYRLAELAFSMPIGIKLKSSDLDASQGKFVLKELASRLLGRDYVYRPKEGFGIPVGKWLREDQSGYLRDTLLAPRSPVYDLVRPEPVRQLAEAHLSGRQDQSPKLWNLLMLDAWLRVVHRRGGR